MARNVLGEKLQPCSEDPLTGYFRDGCCRSGAGDLGVHVVCAEMTDEFLAFSAERGNDLGTPNPESGFPGLRAGQRWCLCARRWQEALEAGVPPPVILEATSIAVLEWVAMGDLLSHSVDSRR
ncbi:MAG TPA: DUF2237 domain-containing protein [Candidatus Krumholzibacteria bacterium]